MRYCSQCLQPDTRPGLVFVLDKCPACHFMSEADPKKWSLRIETLEKIFARYKNVNSSYDCIIGVSGGKDSVRQSVIVRDYFGLRPLLVVVSYPPSQVTQRGISNLNNLSELGFDIYSSHPSPQTWRALMRKSFLEYGNWAKSTELALFAGVPQIALELGINLIIWGENPAIQLGDLGTLADEGWNGNLSKKMNTIKDIDGSSFISEEIMENKLFPYYYPGQNKFLDSKLQIIYLGWAMKTWSLLDNGLFSMSLGLSPRAIGPKSTSDLLSLSSLDEDWVIVNQMIKFYKFGFGKTTEYVNELIRTKIISRNEGIALVEEFDGSCSNEYILSFCDFIEIKSSDFWEVVYKYTNKDLFDIKYKSRPLKKFKVGIGVM